MQTYKRGSHTRYDLKYHIVWITKYRKPVMIGQVAERLRDLIRQICQPMILRSLRVMYQKGTSKTFSVRHCEGDSSKQHIENQRSGLLHSVRNDEKPSF